jgi:hypothetical protein
VRAMRAVRITVRILGMKIDRRAAHAWVTVLGR